MYLWSQRDGWELAPTSVHKDLAYSRGDSARITTCERVFGVPFLVCVSPV